SAGGRLQSHHPSTFNSPTLNHESWNHFTESAGTILMLSTPMRLFGLSWGCVGVVAIFSSTSSPLISLPKAVYFPFRKLGAPWQMKNWLPAESGSFERAIEITPRS